MMWRAAALCAWLLASASARADGGYCAGTRVERGGDLGAAWTLHKGDAAVLVVVTEREGGSDELVVQLPADALAPGSRTVPLQGPAYFQRGGQILTYATWGVAGRVELTVEGGRVTGSAQLTLEAPHVDVLGAGRQTQTVGFALGAWAHCVGER